MYNGGERIVKIFVTGGLGFIGSNFIRYMLNKYSKINIVNFDKQTYASCKSNLKDIQTDRRYYFIKGDICDKKAVKAAMHGCEAVINFAAESHVDRSIKDPVVFLNTNIPLQSIRVDPVQKHSSQLHNH